LFHHRAALGSRRSARYFLAFDKSGHEYKLSACASLKWRFWWRRAGASPAARHLDIWRKTVKTAAWRNLVEVRQSYPDTDAVKVRSGGRCWCSTSAGTITADCGGAFNRQIVYALRFMTHAEYSKDRWKETL